MRIAMLAAGFGLLLGLLAPLAAVQGGEPAENDRLLVIWTSGDRDVALKMVFMYTLNARKHGWWGEVRLLIWGPSSRLLAGDAELQKELAVLKDAGVEPLACKACADGYGVSDKLAELGVDVKYTGAFLTEKLKTGWTVLSF